MPRSRFALLAATTVVVVAFALVVLLDNPTGNSSTAPPSPTVPPAAGPSATTGPSNSGFDGAALPTNVRARDFTLTDETGHRVSLGPYRGQVVVIAFLSSTCRLVSDRSSCVLVAEQIRGALDELPSTVPVLLVSTDPQGDTRANVNRFLAQVTLTGRVHYATGLLSQLRPIWHAYGATPPRAGNAAAASSIAVVLIDKHGFERVVFPIEQLTPEALAHDIRRLQSRP